MAPGADARAALTGYQRLAIAVIKAGMRDPREAARFVDSAAFQFWALVAGLDPVALRREYARRGRLPPSDAPVDT